MHVLAASIIALCSLAMLAVAMRGRRIDDHPLCRKCGYDLTGRTAEDIKCSECGTDLQRRNAIRIGHHVRRRGLAAIASLGLLISTSTIGTIEYFQYRNVNWMEHAPVWVLRYELKSAGPKQLAALAELQARLNLHHLSQPQVNAIADKCLSVQADQSAPWVAAWGDFLETARTAQLLDDSRWSSYATQAPILSIVARPAAVAGDRISVEPMLKSSRISRACFIAYVTVQSASLDGKPVLPEDLCSMRMSINEHRISIRPEGFAEDACFAVPGYFPNESLGGFDHSIDRDLSATLAAGSHTLKVEYLFYMVESDPTYTFQPVKGSQGESMPANLTLDQTRAIGSGTHHAFCTFTIYPANQMPDLLARGQLNRAVSQCISVQAVAEASGRTRLQWNIRRFPARIDFHVYVRRSDGTLEEPNGFYHPMYSARPGKISDDNQLLSSAFDHVAKLDVIFRPDVQKSRESGIDLTPVWADDIVLKDIPVKQP